MKYQPVILMLNLAFICIQAAFITFKLEFKMNKKGVLWVSDHIAACL